MACCAVRPSVLGPLDEGEAGGAFMGDEDALAILGKEHEVGFPMSRHVARAGIGRAFAQRTALLDDVDHGAALLRSEEHTSELQSLMRISYAVFCLKNKK